ncbi:MAG TPA: pyridoxal phosphate-dependent aminotransferase [Candidatus Avimonoglobus intestinipullorum]|uniref:Aminotransferase n=1 Tax=Candidatus Avimonoglobus intestinipullorum TaxID=2840699 RepID=A0A9D1LUL4_9FIRM|nr:pyridoxal phosphate-dependent aminotransferase [Candidatus Avimonoglobus intestinipullorum]
MISKKAMGISPSPTLSIDSKFKEMKANGEDVVGFGAGEPDFDTPQHIKDAAIAAINAGKTKYTPAAGTLALRKAVADKFKRENGLDYKPSNIVVSNGAKHALVNTFMAILNPGDEVIIPAPYWVSYPEMVKLADGVPVSIQTTEEDGFKVTADEIRAAITDKTKALILNSPSNPTGMVYTREELQAIAEVAVEKNIYVVSDEIYEHLIYEGEHVSIASFNDKIKDLTIVINGVSKTYAMTGWRIGYAAANDEIAKAMANIQSHASSNPNSIAQEAAVAALTGGDEEILRMKRHFQKRRDFMVEMINSIDGVSCSMPHGAFYIMMNISKLKGKELYGTVITSSDDFAELFLKVAKVAVVPGRGFEAEDFVRWSYATSMDNIVEGLERLKKFLSGKYE